MPDDELKRGVRAVFAKAVIDVQELYQHRDPAEVVPQIVAALLSLANNIARKNCDLSHLDFIEACVAAARELPRNLE